MDRKGGDLEEQGARAGDHENQQQDRQLARQQPGLQPDRGKQQRRHAVADQAEIDRAKRGAGGMAGRQYPARPDEDGYERSGIAGGDRRRIAAIESERNHLNFLPELDT